MKTHLLLPLFTVVLLLARPGLHAQIVLPKADVVKPAVDPAEAARAEKVADIKALLAATGYENMGRREFDKLLDNYSKSMPRVKAAVWDELRRTADTGALESAIASVYDRAMTGADVKAALAFYQTDAGRKLASVTPQLTEGCGRALTDWQRTMTNFIHTRLNATVAKPGGK